MQQHLTTLAFVLALLHIAQNFEFDIKGTNFAPGGSTNQFSAVNFAEDEDNAGFTSGGNVISSGGSGGVGGTRRLIQPPPLKRSSMQAYSTPLEDDSANAKWMLIDRPSPSYYFLTRI